MVILTGISWNFEKKAENYFSGWKINYKNYREAHLLLEANGIISEKINNFGRTSTISKIYSILAALVLDDFSLNNSQKLNKQETGLIACHYNSATSDNEKYFKDYVQAGRKLARGNLFVYTLPSSPLGETAIAFQLKGPLFYTSFLQYPLNNLIIQSEIMLNTSFVDNLIVFFTDKNGTICLLFGKKKLTDYDNGIPVLSLKENINYDSGTIDLVEYLNCYKKEN